MFGWEGDQFTIANEIKQIRADRNVNVEELVYYVRNFAGWLNIEYRVGGTCRSVARHSGGRFPGDDRGRFPDPRKLLAE